MKLALAQPSCALANKLVRAMWVVLHHRTDFRAGALTG